MLLPPKKRALNLENLFTFIPDSDTECHPHTLIKFDFRRFIEYSFM